MALTPSAEADGTARPEALVARPPHGSIRPPELSRDPSERERWAEDAASWTGRCAAIAWPETEGEWSWLLSGSEPVLPVGARTSLTGGATPRGGIVASTARTRRLLEDSGDRVLVEPGLTVRELQEHLAPSGRFFPPAPTHDSACVGGVVSTDAAGARTFKHGTTRAWVRGLTVALPGGDFLDVERGTCRADERGRLQLVRASGERVCLQLPRHALPDVPKCAAGYRPGPGLDAVDLFVGAEGTLGVVTRVRLDVRPRAESELWLLVPYATERAALRAALRARAAAHRARASGDASGPDVSAIEHLDRRSLELLAEDGVPRRLDLLAGIRPACVLLVVLDLPEAAADLELDDWRGGGADGPVARLLGLLDTEGADLEAAALALPGDRARQEAMAAFREAAPEGVNRRVARARDRTGEDVHKVGGDLIVPVDRLEDMAAACVDVPGREGLDCATWGHASDGNLHPNVVPGSAEEVRRGEAVQLELGRLAMRLGGSPLAEHGVGRHPIKQRLLAELVGPRAMADMRALKRALDPRGILAPGVLLPT